MQDIFRNRPAGAREARAVHVSGAARVNAVVLEAGIVLLLLTLFGADTAITGRDAILFLAVVVSIAVIFARCKSYLFETRSGKLTLTFVMMYLFSLAERNAIHSGIGGGITFVVPVTHITMFIMFIALVLGALHACDLVRTRNDFLVPLLIVSGLAILLTILLHFVLGRTYAIGLRNAELIARNVLEYIILFILVSYTFAGECTRRCAFYICVACVFRLIIWAFAI